MGNQRYVEDIVSHGAETATYLKAYVQRQLEYQKLEATEKASEAGAALTVSMITTLIGGMAAFFLSTALALWLGTVIGSMALGFVCVGGGYVLIFLLVRLLRGSFRMSVQDGIIAFLNKQVDG